MSSVGVIGGGLIGLLSAVRLRQRGFTVCVYEKSHIGKEASWAAAGMLAPSVENAPAYAFASRDAYPALLREIGGYVPYAKCGLRFGDQWFPDEAWVDPRALLSAVKAYALKTGVAIKEQTAASLDTQEDLVVVAAGAWSGQIAPVDVKPMKGVLLRVRGEVPHIHFWHGGYIVPRPNGECIVGSTMEDVGFDKSVPATTVAALLSRARQVVPSLGDVLDQWAGLRPMAAAPILKREGRVIFATGHHRNGILLAPYTADWVAAVAMTPGAPPARAS